MNTYMPKPARDKSVSSVHAYIHNMYNIRIVQRERERERERDKHIYHLLEISLISPLALAHQLVLRCSTACVCVRVCGGGWVGGWGGGR